MSKDLRSLDQRNTTWKSVLEVQSRFPDGIPLLDPIADMKITDDKFNIAVELTAGNRCVPSPHTYPLI